MYNVHYSNQLYNFIKMFVNEYIFFNFSENKFIVESIKKKKNSYKILDHFLNSDVSQNSRGVGTIVKS